jgi:hypothetical protein
LHEYPAGKSSTVSDERSLVELVDPSQVMKTSSSETGRKSPFPTLPSTVLLQVSFPSKELALELIDTYFDHVYNATLLFHRQNLISDYLAGKVPDCVALSIFALAAKYAMFIPTFLQRLIDILVFFLIEEARIVNLVPLFLVLADQARTGPGPRVSKCL